MKSLSIILLSLLAGYEGFGLNSIKNFGKKMILGEELDFNIMGDEYNVNVMPQLFNFGKGGKSKEPVDVPASVQLKADFINGADHYVKNTKREKLNGQIIKFAMKPTMKVLAGIMGIGVGLADRPNFTPKVVEQFSELVEDPEVVNYLFDTLDKLSSQDKNSGEIIKDVIVKPYGGNKRLASYIVKISKEVYKQNPKGSKVLIDRLLEAHEKHDLISDTLAKELKELSENIK